MKTLTNSEISLELTEREFISESEIEKLGEDIFDLIRLIKFVDIDDEYTVNAKCGVWTIKLGFFNHWFTVYRNETPVADCYRGIISIVDEAFNDKEENIIKKVFDEKINKLKT